MTRSQSPLWRVIHLYITGSGWRGPSKTQLGPTREQCGRGVRLQGLLGGGHSRADVVSRRAGLTQASLSQVCCSSCGGSRPTMGGWGGGAPPGRHSRAREQPSAAADGPLRKCREPTGQQDVPHGLRPDCRRPAPTHPQATSRCPHGLGSPTTAAAVTQ